MASALNPTGFSEESSRRNPTADLEAGTSFFAANLSAWAGVAPTLRSLILPAIRLTQKSVMPEFIAALRSSSIDPPFVPLILRRTRHTPVSFASARLRSENIGTTLWFLEFGPLGAV